MSTKKTAILEDVEKAYAAAHSAYCKAEIDRRAAEAAYNEAADARNKAREASNTAFWAYAAAAAAFDKARAEKLSGN
jgi:hypothetical protein